MTIYNGDRRNRAAARVSWRLRRDTLDRDASSTTGGIMNILAKTLPLTLLLALSGVAQAVDGPGHTAGGPNRMAVRPMDPATMTQRMTTQPGAVAGAGNRGGADQPAFRQAGRGASQAAGSHARGAPGGHGQDRRGTRRGTEKVLSEEQYAKHASQQQMMQERRRDASRRRSRHGAARTRADHARRPRSNHARIVGQPPGRASI